MQRWLDPITVEAVHDGSVSPRHLARRAVLHRFGEDGVAVDLEQHHDVLVTTVGLDGETTCLVGVDLAFHFVV